MKKHLLFATIVTCVYFLQTQFNTCLGQSWNLTGNTGTTTSHFLGTTDAKDLRFRTSNTQRMVINSSGLVGIGAPVASWPIFRLDIRQGSINTDSLYRIKGAPVVSLGGGGLTSNIGVGSQALFANTTGSLNTAVGQNALRTNSNGSRNTAVGNIALFSNTTGNDNTAVGMEALKANTSGLSNSALGSGALNGNTTGAMNVAIGTNALRSASTASSNVAVGFSALSSNTTGTQNAATGANAMKNNTTGSGNSANGYNALQFNNTGSQNSAFGAFSLESNTGGANNTAVGYGSLQQNTTGFQNTAVGTSALGLNTTGNANNAFGYAALGSNSTGGNNVAFGSYALSTNTTGMHNSAAGANALFMNTIGINNTAFGSSSLYNNSTGNSNVAIGFGSMTSNISGSYNVASGSEALAQNTTGSLNIAIGNQAITLHTNGTGNSALGYQAMQLMTSGNNTTAIGKQALKNTITGTNVVAVGTESGLNHYIGVNNTFVGVGADVAAAGGYYQNSTAIGFATIIDADNKVRIGNTSVLSIGGQVGWTTYSDGRYKKNVQEDIPGLDFINKLRPVSYTTDINGINNHLTKGQTHTPSFDGNQDVSLQETKRYTGFIAQEVEEAAIELGYDFSGVDVPQIDGNLYGIRYAEFVVPIVKAIQEQQAIIEKQQQEIEDLKSLLQAQNTQGTLRIGKVSTENEILLGQNIPNPADASTIIPFIIPADCKSASILITESTSGRAVKAIQLSCSDTQLMLEAGALSAGSYIYSLFVDGIMIDSKRMIVAH